MLAYFWPLKIEAARFSETSVKFCRTTRIFTSEDSPFQHLDVIGDRISEMTYKYTPRCERGVERTESRLKTSLTSEPGNIFRGTHCFFREEEDSIDFITPVYISYGV